MLVLFELMVTLSFTKRISGILKVRSIYVATVVYVLATALFFVLPKEGLVNRVLCVKLYWHFFPFFMMGYYSYRLNKLLVMKYAPIYLLAYLAAFYAGCLGSQKPARKNQYERNKAAVPFAL